MHDNQLATDMYVAAHVRIANSEGVPVTVLRKGDPSSGTIVLKVNLLNRTARVYVEARYEGKRVWILAMGRDLMEESEADAYVTRQGEVDPDAWLIEVEDRRGRLWFPGKIVTA